MQFILPRGGIIMDRFHLMTVYVAVAEEEGLAAAARRLGMSAPAVTRAVSLLEERLGVRLLTRTTRVVRVTEAGARYLEDARRILMEADEADQAAAGVNATPRGHLAVTAPVMFGRLYVTPIITEYQTTYTQTTVSALFVDRIVNLVDEGLDAGIRIGALPDSSLRAVRVGRVRWVVCAAPAYLDQYGAPRFPSELVNHRIVATTAVSRTPEWTFAQGHNRLAVKINPRILVNTNDAALEAAKLGFGLTRVLSYQAAPQLASGELKAVLVDFEGADVPIQVIHREGRHGSAKVRSFVDLAVARLRADRALN